MRLAKHLKIISPQVEHLEDLESQLEILLDYVKNATKEGNSWINNTDNKLTFLQISQLLTNAAAHCIKKCVEIANENDESSPSCQPSFTAGTISATAEAIFGSSEVSTPDNIDDTTTKCLNDRLKKVEEIVSQNSNKIRSSTAKIKDLEKRNDIFASQLDETNKRNDIKSDEIMKEFEDASNFMSNLQLKIEALSYTFEKLQPDISERLKHVEEQLDSISKSGSDLNKDTLMKYVDERIKTVSKSCSVAKAGTDYLAIQLSDEVKSLRKDIDTVNANLASTKGKIHETRIEECKRNLDIKEKVFLIETQMKEIIERSEQVSQAHLNQKCTDQDVGFSATVKNIDRFCRFRGDRIVNCFKDVLIDLQNNFDPSTGIFTAPCDGLYLCTLMIDANSIEDDLIHFELIHKDNLGNENVMTKVFIRNKDTLASGIGFGIIAANDQIYVKPFENYDKTQLSIFTSLMCLLIHKR